MGGGFSAGPLLPGRGSRIAPQLLKLSRHHDTSLAMVGRQPRTVRTHTCSLSKFVLRVAVKRSGGVCMLPLSKKRPCLFRLLFFFSSPFCIKVSDGGRSADMGRSTNKQTNKQKELKERESRPDEMWRHVSSAARLMACSSHYSLWCPLPPIGCNNTSWHGCHCHIISHFLLTTWTMRAISHQDRFSASCSSGSCVCSRWERSFTVDLIKNTFS